MDNKKIRGSSSSSFTSDLFGARESSQSSSSTGIFSTIFPPPSTKQHPGDQAWSKGTPGPDNMTKNKEGISHSKSNVTRSSIFQERVEPCPLGSSLYYGGQEDMFVHSSKAQKLGSYSKGHFKKNEGVDDDNNSHSASRGNWWEGSLYY